MKSLIKTFIITLFALTLFLPFYHPSKVKAHEISEKPWLLVNNANLVIDDSNPSPSKLPSFEHNISKNFQKNENINLEIQAEVIKETFKVDSFSIDWVISIQKDYLTTKKLYEFSGDQITFKPSGDGVYSIQVFSNSGDKELFDDEIGLFVGNPPKVNNFSVDGKTITAKEVINTDREQFLNFKVINPDSTKYKYVWDLGEGDLKEGIETSKLFLNSNLPLYIFLRKIDLTNGLYLDSYVKVDSTIPPQFPVNKPPVQNLNPITQTTNNNLILIIIGVAFAFIILIGSVYLVKSRKR